MITNPMVDPEKVVATVAKVEMEPWMVDFMKERHTQDEWDAFFVYCQAGQWKRRMMRWASVMVRIAGII